VITDVVMPDENVFDVLPRNPQAAAEVPVIVMKRAEHAADRVNAAEIGAFDYIPKPFDLDDITATARRALGPAHQHRSGAGPGAGDARRTAAADRPLAADAGGLPHHRAAGGRRPDGADPRRIRHRQGPGRAGAA